MSDKVSLYLCRIVLVAGCLLLGACSTLGYYKQAVAGHVEVIQARRPLHEVLEDNEAPDALKRKLRFVSTVLEFAHDRLELPDNGSYRHYADLNRPFVAWNIFAAPELSLEPRKWCYLFIGCFPYRGYFEHNRARQHAAQLDQEGLDVYIGGVRAYSTLGWFRDPVLNTMLDQEEWEIARLIFHELAHQKIYIKNQGDFNEAFAESVARIGLDLWLQTRSPEAVVRIRQALDWEDAVFSLILDYKTSLKIIYDSDLRETDKRGHKRKLLVSLQQDYQKLKQQNNGDDRFDRWLAADFNNGKLAAVSTYRRLIPAFLGIYAASGRRLDRFYDYIQGLRRCDSRQLRQRLTEYSPKKTC